jgi:hypothetical protein
MSVTEASSGKYRFYDAPDGINTRRNAPLLIYVLIENLQRDTGWNCEVRLVDHTGGVIGREIIRTSMRFALQGIRFTAVAPSQDGDYTWRIEVYDLDANALSASKTIPVRVSGVYAREAEIIEVILRVERRAVDSTECDANYTVKFRNLVKYTPSVRYAISVALRPPCQGSILYLISVSDIRIYEVVLSTVAWCELQAETATADVLLLKVVDDGARGFAYEFHDSTTATASITVRSTTPSPTPSPTPILTTMSGLTSLITILIALSIIVTLIYSIRKE